jgi:pimeloyl-ACP methyl ester carboxylesterase
MPDVVLRGGEVDGLRLHYLVDGRGPSVILVHGLGGFAEYWRHNVGPLAARATVYALDLPGFGLSAKPRTEYPLSYLARAVGGFMDTLGLAQASVVGHSLGGAVATTYALMHPSRVERLALLGALVPGFAYKLSWPARIAALYGIGEALSRCGCAPLYKAAIARCFFNPNETEIDFLVDTCYAERTGPEARAAFLATLRHVKRDFVDHAADYRRALATLEAPVLMIHGRQDGVVPWSHCAEVARGMPRAVVRSIERCGHFPHIEHAAAVNGWLADFLVGRPAPR